jgi:photosystem II stability/assembly factor-like uncharacterized protein
MSVNSVRRAPASLLAAVWISTLVCGGALAGELKAKSQIVEDLYDTAFVDANQGWAVGVFGAVYHTADAGKHWTIQATPTTQHLYGVSFIDAKTGWAVGRSGEILHTADGGEHWTQQTSGTPKHLFKVEFTTPTEGWVVGDWGVVLHTADGGQTWTAEHSLAEDQILYAVDFAEGGQFGWMVGEFGSILYTNDAGGHWSRQQVASQKTFFGVTAVSKDKAWAVGIDGVVVRTRDGGVTWEVQRGRIEAQSFETLGFMEMLKNPGLYDIKIRGEKGYIVGDIGNVIVTEDGGETWTSALLPPEWRLNWIRGLSVLPSGEGLVVGAAGLTFSVNGKEMRFSQSGA